MSAERLLKNLLRRLGLQPGRHGTKPDGGGPGAAVVDVSRWTVSLQLTVWGQAL